MARIRELERGVWLDESVPESFRRDVEMLCHLLSDCVADLVTSLSLFEQARIADTRRIGSRSTADHEEWRRESERHRAREAELEAAGGLVWGAPDHFERSEQIREHVRREVLREKWEREGGPETYRRRLVFIHARSFVTTLAVLQRSLIPLCEYDFEPEAKAAVESARDGFAFALPGLKDVRDSTTHVEDRIRGQERFGRKMQTQPLTNGVIHAPNGAPMIIEMLNDSCYGGTIANGTYAEVEVTDAATETARVAVQAVFDALPWRPGHTLHEPSL
jgi:hypothetical protein